MLKIPTFIIGGLLIITGLASYLLQDLGLSIKLNGPLADDAEFILSDGNQTIPLEIGYPSSKSAGEYAFWVVHLLNQNHAKDRSQANFAIEHGSTAYDKTSFWHASSKYDTQTALATHAQTGELGDLKSTDTNRSVIRFVYKNLTGNSSLVSLSSNNWQNIDSKIALNPGDSLTFDKSWTAFIPGIIGILLILLVQVAEKKPNSKKHIMHLAVSVALICFIMIGFNLLPKAWGEMNFLKGEPYGIIHASSLKSIVMLSSAGLLLVFVIICVQSFISARKEMAAQSKVEADKKKKVLDKVKIKNEETDDKKSHKDDEHEDEDDEKSSKESTKGDDKKSDSDSKESKTKKSANKDEPSKPLTKSVENDEKKIEPATKKEMDYRSKEEPTENKKEEPNKTTASSKDSNFSSSKDQDDSKKDTDDSINSGTEEKEEEKPEPKSDGEKSDKEEKKE